MVPVLRRVVEGESSTIMSYGERRSGKSHNFGITGNDEDLLAKSITFWFQNYNLADQESWVLTMSCFELYQGEVRDLLKDPD